MGEPVPAFRMASGLEEFSTEVLTSAGDASGFDCRNLAMAPTTNGVAIDVPDAWASAVSLVYQAEMMPDPGAKRSTHGPKLEPSVPPNIERWSESWVAPTVNAVDTLPPGEWLQASTLSFPAESTQCTPLLMEFLIAFSITTEGPG